LVEGRKGFERKSHELADGPVKILEKSLTLSGKKEEGCQEKSKQS
jgi:hypothetical protein